jgi:hypothetical protein
VAPAISSPSRVSTIIGCALIALAGSLSVLATAGVTAPPSHKSITCKYLNEYDLTFDIPANLGELPVIDFVYPSSVTIFSFRAGRLLVICAYRNFCPT